MRRELPGTAKYYRPLVAPLPCSVDGCNEPAHASYRTATGLSFCMSHRTRYQLVELAQRFYPEHMTSRKTVKQSPLQQWIDLAITGDDETIQRCMEAIEQGKEKCQSEIEKALGIKIDGSV